MEAAGSGKTVALAVQPCPQGGEVRFGRLEGIGQSSSAFPKEAEKIMVDELRGRIRVDPGAGEIVLTLPADITAYG
jgi:hypothetical protein